MLGCSEGLARCGPSLSPGSAETPASAQVVLGPGDEKIMFFQKTSFQVVYVYVDLPALT